MQSIKIIKLVLILFIALYTDKVYVICHSNTIAEEANTKSQKSANYIFNPKLLYFNYINDDCSLYNFYIEDVHQLILKQPNRVEHIKFNGNHLILSDSTKFPCICNWSFVIIYANEQNAPLLIHIISSKRNYFYSIKEDTGKWHNHSIDGLKENRAVDENGIIYYKSEDEGEFNELRDKLYKEYLGLSERFINYYDASEDIAEEKSSNDNIVCIPTLEINMELTEILCASAPPIEDEYFPRPKLELSSFRGEGDVRIQTYSLEVELPVARVILIHGYMCNFSSEFLNYNLEYFDSVSNIDVKEYILHNLNAIERNIKLKYKYGEDLVSAEELKSMVDGQLKLEDRTVDVYKDGTDGWATTDRYVYEESFVQALNLNNISVHGLDLRSFGASEAPRIFGVDRARGLIDDFDNMSKDLITFTNIIKEKYNDNLPIFLVGVSMGGAVATRALELCGNERLVDGAILIATMMKFYEGIFSRIDNWARWLMKVIVFFGRKIQVKVRDVADEDYYKSLFRTDDLYCPTTHVYFGAGFNLLKGCSDSIEDAGKIYDETPLLIIHSVDDDVSFFEGTEKLYSGLGHVKRKYFIRLYNMTHRETTLHRYFTPICDFIIKWIKDINKDYKVNQV